MRRFLLVALITATISSNIIIRNSGCNAYDEQGVCKSCSTRFYKDVNSICQPVNPNCKTYDSSNGDCLSCYSGFGLLEGTCLPGIQDEQTLDLNCNTFQQTVCLKCSSGYYFDKDGKCAKADPNCLTFTQQNGDCLSCYPSFTLSSGKCLIQQPKSIDPNCNQLDSNNKCIKCSSGYFFTEGVCTKIDDSCKTFQIEKNHCSECYPGYVLDEQYKCVQQTPKDNKNPLCAQWNSTVCVKCAKGSSFDQTRMCVLQDSYCKSSDSQTGLCKKCYSGYVLNNGVCKLQTQKEITDPNCYSFGSSGACSKCSTGYYFNSVKVCVKIDDNCKSFSSANKRCMECYPGYQLGSAGECLLIGAGVTDVNCAQWNGTACLRCSFGAVFNTAGQCTVIDPQCKEYDQHQKICKSCYNGYQLDSTSYKCVQSTVSSVSDSNCAEWQGSICSKCSFGSVFDNFAKCILIDAQCKHYDQTTGHCINCYPGYSLDTSFTCVKSEIQNVNDVLCAEWKENICLKCSLGSYFNHEGICIQYDSSCKQSNQATGKCQSCYVGYELSVDKICVKAVLVQQNNPLCSQWDTTGVLCFKCSIGSFFNSIGVCDLIDPLCKTSDSLKGTCTSCFDGYQVNSNGKCIKSEQQSRDPLCAQFSGSICTKCSFGAYFDPKGICQSSDSLCSQFNKQTGVCTACYPGHALRQGKCEVDESYTVSDPFCAEFQNEICLKCSSGYYFQKDGKCTAADPLCATFDQMNGNCSTCFAGYKVNAGRCIQKQEAKRDDNCAAFNSDNSCKQCSKGFIFDQRYKLCHLANPLCKNIDSETGACTSCYSGYVIFELTCVLDQNAESSFCAQMIDSICVRCASRTFLNSKGQCEKVSEDCRTYNDFDGHCLSCYSGFALSSGNCLKDNVKNGCSSFDSNGKCTKCSTGFYLASDSCTEVDPQCANFNLNSLKCQGCYSGYTLLQGRCEISKVSQEQEVKNCVAYNTEYKCMQCFDRFYLTNNQCKDVSVFCKTYDLITGQCTGCYSGFKLKIGQCTK